MKIQLQKSKKTIFIIMVAVIVLLVAAYVIVCLIHKQQISQDENTLDETTIISNNINSNNPGSTEASEEIIFNAKEYSHVNDCNGAIEILSGDFANYSYDERAYIYSEAMDIANDCENQEAYQKFSNLYLEVSDKITTTGGA